MKKKIVFIINPRAGVDRVKAIEGAVMRYIDQSVYDPRFVYTARPHHGIELAREAAENGAEVVVAVGGDGSINDVVQGIFGTDTALGIIPLGSGNGLARSVGIPLNLKAAVLLLNKQNIHAIDVGQVDGKHFFVSNAGVGFDAVVTDEFRHSRKRGFWSYIQIINRYVWKYKAQDWDLIIDGQVKRERAFMITVANATQLGYNFMIAPLAKLNDGVFEIVVIRRFPKVLAPIIGLQAFTESLLKNRYVKHYRARNVQIINANNKVMQMDGESIDCGNSISICLHEKSVRLLCP